MVRPRKAHQTQFHRSQIGRAQRFIRLHMDSALTLGQIAREAGASPFHFARIFLAYAGETPFDFLRRIRLTTAIRMLQEDPFGSITEIALSVGYETPSAFNKVFKQKTRMSPREFRNLGKGATIRSRLSSCEAVGIGGRKDDTQYEFEAGNDQEARRSFHLSGKDRPVCRNRAAYLGRNV